MSCPLLGKPQSPDFLSPTDYTIPYCLKDDVKEELYRS